MTDQKILCDETNDVTQNQCMRRVVHCFWFHLFCCFGCVYLFGCAGLSWHRHWRNAALSWHWCLWCFCVRQSAAVWCHWLIDSHDGCSMHCGPVMHLSFHIASLHCYEWIAWQRNICTIARHSNQLLRRICTILHPYKSSMTVVTHDWAFTVRYDRMI